MVRKLALGSTHSCVLLDAGAVHCWGSALFSQLGYPGVGTITDGAGETPASVGDLELGGAAIDLDAGDRHSCVVRATGDVLCWGDGERGKLGYASTEIVGDDETPASVGAIELGGSARQVVTGYNHSCALLTSGRVRCWG